MIMAADCTRRGVFALYHRGQPFGLVPLMALRLPLIIGTRGSPLALAQTHDVRARLRQAEPLLAAPDAIRIEVIKTSGDRFLDRPLAEIGGKGLFTKEIEEAMLEGRIDLAVHSMKDVPTWLPDGLIIGCVLPREDPRDVLIANGITRIEDLAPGARVGTASLRRQAQLLTRRADLAITVLRGNVETRLRKVRAREADATLLALAGLKRLGRTDHGGTVLETAVMLPAVAQGAVGIECRAADEPVCALLARLNDRPSADAIAAERALLATLEGSCRTPIAALATLDRVGVFKLEALIATPDGKIFHRGALAGAAADAVRLGETLGLELKARAGPGFFAHLA
jgi:hydroxymethylbilane synthase